MVHEINQRWAVALGGQLIAPTATNGVATNAWEQVTGVVARAMLPEISQGSYFAPQVRYGVDFGGNDEGRLLRQLRIGPTLNINLPHDLFFTLFPSPDIRVNYGTPVWGQTGRWFFPLNFSVGWKPTEHTVVSAEFGIPIIKDFPAYSFKLLICLAFPEVAAAWERVRATSVAAPGWIIINARARTLYFVLDERNAVRYPIAVPKRGMEWAGEASVSGKYIRPDWVPPARVKADHPELPNFIRGGSPNNPMGARAITLDRSEVAIHGTTMKMRRSIGTAASYGCIRMRNEDVIDLFNRVSIGTPVLMVP